MEDNRDVLHYLKEDAKNIEIPESITPERMRKRLEQRESEKQGKQEYNKSESSQIDKEKAKRKKRFFNDSPYKYIVAAACLCLVMGTMVLTMMGKRQINESSFEAEEAYIEVAEETEEAIEGDVEESELLAAIEYPEITYEDIYESMFGNMEQMMYQSNYRGEMVEGFFPEESLLTDGAIPEAPAGDVNTSVTFKEEAAVEKSQSLQEDSAEYGTTNIQTQGVEEADVVKNDGRYLYQIIYQEKDYVYTQAIQIVDTVDGLKEVKRIEGFDNIQEFYVWEDTLVIIENKYLETVQAEARMEKVMVADKYYVGDNRQFYEISFYNIKDRSMPYKIKTFTLKGRYDSSRIAEGYFYGFSKFYATPGEGEADYASYIPQVDGVQLKAEQILLPEENEGNSYLLLTSIDMKNPRKFIDTTAIVTDSDMYYVSSENIYIADSLPLEQVKGKQTNQISLLRFSYKKGKFALQAEGKVPGSLESSFSMDEYAGNLRMVTTVDEYLFKEIKDDITGEILGNYMESEQRSNAFYVLDPDLKIIGKIENLAEGERIYSARFMDEVGYFVTFRQTDPLFAVDLKDAQNPKILSELKISGFSEYMHFYGEDRLLGIGMEADEETGRTEGMKLSMFDISDPGDVQEISKLHLKSYDYSEALYNHRAVMISTSANIFGFEMEGYIEGNFKRDYVVYSYEDEMFVEKLKVEMNNKYGGIYSGRGTFIGDTFYLLIRDGSVKSFDLKTGTELESI